MEWQPIETAPTDWTDVIVYAPENNDFNCGGIFSAFFDHEDKKWIAYGPTSNNTLTPTHWMPLPEPPKPAKSERDEEW